ncbi:MAG: right-handed parallel beta-helix repeat-containing protein [Candidatus Methylarchaceae archaeon HK02M2]|nr:right-handed parallel beta-helix repeat-containing protein [Candidatus Methylarchaceae archaeon HK02M2]
MINKNARKITSSFIITLFIFSIILTLILSVPIKPSYASPTEIDVYPGDGIQAAINSASSGDIIIIHEGVFEENIDVNKTVNLIAEGAVTINAADPSEHVFNVTVNNVNITGFNIAGATGIVKAGIYLYDASYCNITNNNLSNNENGVFISTSSDHNILLNNIANLNEHYGIILESYCSYNKIINNTANYNGYDGIWLNDSNNYNILENNTANYNDYNGIRLTSSNHNTLVNNTAKYNTEMLQIGIHLRSSSYNTLVNNTSNFNNDGIYLGYESNYNTLINNTVISNEWGMFLYDSHYNTFQNNVFNSNDMDGIKFDASNNNTIVDNTSNSNGMYGFNLDYSSKNIISNNIFSSNNGSGTILYDSSNFNTYINNIISSNDYQGISLYNSDHNIFKDNSVYNNDEGIYLESSSENLIYHNNFMNNTVNVYDDNPELNDWHHLVLLEGNYWSNYTGLDDGSGIGKHSIAGDGIGDTLIPHPEDNYDFYPFVGPIVETATGTGITVFNSDYGSIFGLKAVDESELPLEGKPSNLIFIHGFFSFDVIGLNPGQTVTINILYPSDIPTYCQYWIYYESWFEINVGDNDGDRVITIQLTDGGSEDKDGEENGIITDAGGIGSVQDPGDYIVTEYLTDNLVEITPDGDRNMIYEFDALTYPWGIAIDSDGNYIVTEYLTDNLVEITPNGIRTVIYEFEDDTNPHSVVIDADGNYIVTEYGAENLVKIIPSGARTVIYEFEDGTGIRGIVIDSEGNYIVVESSIENLVKITPSGVRTVIYEFGDGSGPLDVDIDSDGNYIVTEYLTDNLVEITPNGIRTVIYEFEDGTEPYCITIDNEGNYIVTESYTENLVKISPEGARTMIYDFNYWTGLREVIIYPDFILPILSITSPTSGSELTSSNVTVMWTGSDAHSGIDHYEIRLDEGSWINVLTSNNHNFSGVSNGSHTIYVKAIDGAGNSNEASVNFTVNTGIILGLDLTTIVIILALIIIFLFVVIYRDISSHSGKEISDELRFKLRKISRNIIYK